MFSWLVIKLFRFMQEALPCWVAEREIVLYMDNRSGWRFRGRYIHSQEKDYSDVCL